MTNWDKRFLELAGTISRWSKDESTKVGCVIVGKNREILTTGYNGLPRGADDSLQERQSRPEKYFWYEHAERNAVYNAARTGISLEGSTAYSTLCPCMDCARCLVQSGIRRVVTYEIDKTKYSQLWDTHFPKTIQLFKECNVELIFV